MEAEIQDWAAFSSRLQPLPSPGARARAVEQGGRALVQS